MQIDKKDCGPACLQTIFKYYKAETSIDNIRQIAGTSLTGTTLLGLKNAAEKLGFYAEGYEADLEQLTFVNSPVILHVTLEDKRQHYVVFFGTTMKQKIKFAIIGDPAKGITYMSFDDLSLIWQSKACLVLTPSPTLPNKQKVKTEQLSWLKSLIKKDINLLLIAAFLGICMAALGLAMAIFTQRLIDEFLPQKQVTKIFIGIGLVFLVLLAKEGITFLRSLLLLRQAKAFNMRIIEDFFGKLLHLPKPFFDTRKIGDFTARLNDTARIERVIIQIAGNSLLDIVIVVVSMIFVFTYSITIGLITLFSIPFFFLLIYSSNKKIREGQRTVMVGYALIESNYISTLQGMDAIKNHKKESLFALLNKTIYNSYQSAILKLGRIQIWLALKANIFVTLLLCALLSYLSHLVITSHLKIGEMMAIITMIGSLLPSVANLALLSIPINEARIAFERMFEFAGIKNEATGTVELTIFDKCEVFNLSFRYPGRNLILQNISFNVSKGEIIALMGENGSGKSTIVQLLMQHYYPENGYILVNNTKYLSEVESNSWKYLVSIVPQQVHIFNGTVLENISFDDAIKKPQEVIDFLVNFGFMQFIDSLPQSVMTLVGDEGINLSGGQRQMIAMARALYHHPQLLILDEATSAMDRESELFVLQLLNRLKPKMGIIVITHRLHILKSFCDRIYVLDRGTITSTGNHESLLQSNNLYSQYWADIIS
jgi:ATP-binding cassette subfamily B protein